MNPTSRIVRAGHLDDSTCADLVLELLPEELREAALSHAVTCMACERRFQSHVAAAERARADWGARGTGGLLVTAPLGLRARAASARGWLLATAAVLAIAIGLPMVLSRPLELERKPAQWLPALGEPVHTRDGEREDPHLSAGLEAYRAHDLAAANRELSLARGEGSAEPLRRLYLANVRYQLGDARAALDLLNALPWRSLPEPWRHDGVVLLARVLRANGRVASADSLEKALRDLPQDTPYVP